MEYTKTNSDEMSRPKTVVLIHSHGGKTLVHSTLMGKLSYILMGKLSYTQLQADDSDGAYGCQRNAGELEGPRNRGSGEARRGEEERRQKSEESG